MVTRLPALVGLLPIKLVVPLKVNLLKGTPAKPMVLPVVALKAISAVNKIYHVPMLNVCDTPDTEIVPPAFTTACEAPNCVAPDKVFALFIQILKPLLCISAGV